MIIIKFIFIVALLLIPITSFAKSSPVISANGFACSKSERGLVKCTGAFEDYPYATIFEVMGVHFVQIHVATDYPDLKNMTRTPRQYIYSSLTGCVVIKEGRSKPLDAPHEYGELDFIKAKEINRNGKTKTLRLMKDGNFNASRECTP